MFNIGFAEFLVIGVVALLVIGPKQLPQVAKVVGRLIGELRRATQDLGGGLLEVTQEVKSTIDDTKQNIVNEGRKVVDSYIDDEDDGHHDHGDDHSDESVESKKKEPIDGKS